MKIIASESVKKKTKKEGTINSVTNMIFSICKEDENFSIKQDISEIENQLTSVQAKISKQDVLLQKANEMRDDILMRIADIDDKSFSIKVRVLESLGSEL